MSRSVVSVIIPCYRLGEFLGGAIESARRQTYPATEIVVVNDGSDDSTQSVIAGYGSAVRSLSTPHVGLPAARNAGIDAASGRYVLFLDADDLLDPEALSCLVEAAGERDDRIGMGGWRDFVTSPDEPGAKDNFPLSEGIPFPQLINRNLAAVHCFLAPLALVRRVGRFEPSLSACEDWDLWIRAARAGAEFVALHRVVALYRRRESSMSGDRRRMLAARALVLLRLHAAWIDDAAALEKYGRELAQAEHRVLRRLLACQLPEHEMVARLKQALDELEGRGCTVPMSAAKRLLRRIAGEYVEDLSIGWLRMTDRPTIESLQNEIY